MVLLSVFLCLCLLPLLVGGAFHSTAPSNNNNNNNNINVIIIITIGGRG
jgi:hypothetical protein